MKTPGWGKAIGIIMIVLGSLGVFYQGYRIMIPKIMEMQYRMFSDITEVMDEADTIDPDNPTRIKPQKVFDSFQDEILLSQNTITWLPILGGIGVLFCIFYIVGGAMLLKARPISYKMAVSALIAMLALNIFACLVLIPNDSSLMLFGLLVYSCIGIAMDIALLIILLLSNKAAYGIGRMEEPQ